MEVSANEYGELPTTLKGNTSILIADVANASKNYKRVP